METALQKEQYVNYRLTKLITSAEWICLAFSIGLTDLTLTMGSNQSAAWQSLIPLTVLCVMSLFSPAEHSIRIRKLYLGLNFLVVVWAGTIGSLRFITPLFLVVTAKAALFMKKWTLLSFVFLVYMTLAILIGFRLWEMRRCRSGSMRLSLILWLVLLRP